MNIGILIPKLNDGGAERVAQIIGNHYFEGGHNVYYFLMDTSAKQAYPVKGRIIDTGIAGIAGNTLDKSIVLFGRLLKASLIMRKWKLKYHIDVAISFMEECNYINVLSKGREKVITRVCTILSKRGDMKGLLYDKRMIRLFYRCPDQVVVMCDYAIEDMHNNYGIPYKKLKKISNPAIRHESNRAAKDWTYGDNAIICVGRLTPVKQQERIIRAFSYVHAHCGEAKLLILGRGPNKKYLENMCNELTISDFVFFIGFVDDIGFYLKNSKIFVMSSRVEGFPNSMVEAMAFGLPIVTTDSPGACGEIVGKGKNKDSVSEIRYCKYGILTPAISGKVRKVEQLSGEEVLLGEAIKKVLMEKDVYDHYKRRSLERAKMFQMDNIMKKWNRLLGLDGYDILKEGR